MDKKKVCVIILDGMPYSILNGLLNNGIMPHLEKIYNNSKRGIIQSDIPITPIVWSSMVTWKTPFQTGFSDVRTIDKFYNIYKQSIGRKNIWAYLNEKGIRCGLFNAPYIYPVQKINGFMTTGKEGGGTNTYRDFTYPYSQKIK